MMSEWRKVVGDGLRSGNEAEKKVVYEQMAASCFNYRVSEFIRVGFRSEKK